MLDTCEDYAATHNLKFSTDPNQAKCKTKTMSFIKHQRPLPSLQLRENLLPWTDKVKHLRTTITNKTDGCEKGTLVQ